MEVEKEFKVVSDYCSRWLDLKREAIKSKDYTLYNWFLKETKKEFSKLYVKVTKPLLISLVELVLKIATCEIKENIIKYKKIKISF